MLKPGWGLLSQNPDYRYFLAARTTSILGTWVTVTALVLYLEATGASASAVGALLLARALPQALGPLAGTVADRMDGRKLMVICDLGQAVLVALIAFFLPPLFVLVGLVAVASTFSTLFLPAGRSAVPKLVGSEGLTSANALLASSSNLSYAVGPALGGLLIASTGLRFALLFNATTFLVSAVLLWKLHPLPPSRSDEDSHSASRSFGVEFREGLSYVRRHRVVRALSVGLFLSVAFAAMDNVALVFLTRDVLGAGEASYGLALSAWAIGMIVAPLLLLRGGARIPTELVILLGLGLTGTGLVLTGLAPSMTVAVLVLALGGAGNGLENVGTDTLIQKTVPAPMLGRVFGTVYGPIFLAESLAYALGGPLVELTSPRTVFFMAGGGVLATLVLMYLILRHAARQADSAA